MKTKELKKLRTEEKNNLESLLLKKNLELTKLQVKILGGKEKNLKAAKNLKREIAQMMTIIKEKNHENI